MTHGRRLKDCALRIVRSGKVLSTKAYSVDEDAHLQMQTLILLVQEAKKLMDQLRPVQPDDSRQGILLPLDGTEVVAGKVVYIPNEQDGVEQEVNSNE